MNRFTLIFCIAVVWVGSFPLLSRANPHRAGFGGSFRLGALGGVALNTSGNASLSPSGSIDFRTWTADKIFGFGLHFGMNLIAAGSNPSYGIAPGLSFDFGLYRKGVILPYLGVKLQFIYVYSGYSGGGLLLEIQPRFGVEMFLFLQRKMSLFVEVGVPITVPIRGGGVVVEFGNLGFGFRYYI